MGDDDGSSCSSGAFDGGGVDIYIYNDIYHMLYFIDLSLNWVILLSIPSSHYKVVLIIVFNHY